MFKQFVMISMDSRMMPEALPRQLDDGYNRALVSGQLRKEEQGVVYFPHP